jgi:hypothetical protein
MDDPIDVVDIPEELESVLDSDAGVNGGSHESVGVGTSVGEEIEGNTDNGDGDAGIGRDDVAGVSGMGVSL